MKWHAWIVIPCWPICIFPIHGWIDERTGEDIWIRERWRWWWGRINRVSELLTASHSPFTLHTTVVTLSTRLVLLRLRLRFQWPLLELPTIWDHILCKWLKKPFHLSSLFGFLICLFPPLLRLWDIPINYSYPLEWKFLWLCRTSPSSVVRTKAKGFTFLIMCCLMTIKVPLFWGLFKCYMIDMFSFFSFLFDLYINFYWWNCYEYFKN